MIAYRKLGFLTSREHIAPVRLYVANLVQRLHTSSWQDNKTDPTDSGAKPKKPLNAYMLFCNSNMQDFKAKFPDKTQKEIVKELASIWGSLDHNTKQSYQKQYESKMEVYRRELEQYKSTTLMQQSHSGVPLKPKKPMNAFLLYKQSRNLEHVKSNQPYKEWQRQIANDWHFLRSEDKAVFEKRAEELKHDYEREINAWKEKMLSEGHNTFNTTAKGRAGNQE